MSFINKAKYETGHFDAILVGRFASGRSFGRTVHNTRRHAQQELLGCLVRRQSRNTKSAR